MPKKILLIGGFNKAKSLAAALLSKKYSVTLINDDFEKSKKLATTLNATVILGDGTKPYVLNDASASEFDIAIALTPKDEDNLVICQLCKKRFNIPKTISLLTDANKKDFFYKMGIDVVVSATSIISSIIEQEALVDQMIKITHIGEGNVKVTEIIVSENSISNGKKIMELTLPKDLIISCILRNGSTIIPKGDTVINTDDRLVIVSALNMNDFSAFVGGYHDEQI